MAVSSPPTRNLSTAYRQYSYHVEAARETDNRAEKFLSAFSPILRHSNYRFLVELYSKTSAHCGRCAASSQVYQASNDPRDIPCHRTNLLLDVYRQYFTASGQFRSRVLGEGSLSDEKIDEMAELHYRCMACRRYSMECPMGIDHGLMTHLGRYILSEAGIAPKGLVVSVREQLEGVTGNTSAIPLPALLDNLEFLQDELRDMKGISATFPVDREGAEYIFFPAVSDYLMEADTLMGNAAALLAAGTSWTIGSQYFDGINYGLFYNDWVLNIFVSGFIAGRAWNPIPYDGLMLFHTLNGMALLLISPFTKIAHCVLFPLIRLGTEVAWHFTPQGGSKAVPALHGSWQSILFWRKFVSAVCSHWFC